MNPPNREVSFDILVPLGVIVFICVASFMDLSIRMYRRSNRILPKVLAGLAPPKYLDKTIALLLLEPSEILAHDALVSVYIKDNKFEVLLGVGHVFTVQEDGRIQVLITSIEPSQREKALRIVQNDAAILESLIVKATFPRSHLKSSYEV